MTAATRSRTALPSFARRFPSDAALEKLVGAFDRGDYGTVRRDAPRVIAEATSTEVRAAARLILERTRPDPASAWFVGLAALLLGILAAYWFVKAGGRA